MTNGHKFKNERVKAFNYRATYHLGSAIGFNLKQSEEGSDFARSLLTECWDIYAKPHQADSDEYAKAMARLALGVEFLEDDSVSDMRKKLVQMAEAGDIPKKEAYPREYTLSLAAAAAKSIKERFEASLGTDDVNQNFDTVHPESTERHEAEETEELPREKRQPASRETYRLPSPPDYSDPEDVIKYLFEVGMVSPSHAAALLVTLGFERPQGGISEELKNDMNRIRNDLRARIAMFRMQKLRLFELDGVRTIEVFIEKSADNPNLRLMLDDPGRMVAVGSALVALHQLSDVRSDRPAERSGKYDGTGAMIDFD